MSLSLIVAMDPNRVIGKDNDLPWPRIKEDMKFFRKITTGHVVIMGRKTWDSIYVGLGKPLPKRTNFVVTRQEGLEIEGCRVFNSLDEAIEEALKIDDSPMIIGGSSLYEMALPLVGSMYITQVKKEYDGDTFFPKFDTSLWKERILNSTENAIFTKLLRRTGL